MNEGGMVKPALIGGVLLGVLSALPVVNAANCFCCAWVIAGGVLAAYLHVKGSLTAVSLGSGAGLGLLAGVTGAIVDFLFSLPIQFLMRRAGLDLVEDLRKTLEQIPSIPSETRDALLALLADSSTFSVAMLVIGGIFKLFVYAVMAMLGAMIGVALFEKRKPGQGGPQFSAPTAPPPPEIPLPPPPPPAPPSSGS